MVTFQGSTVFTLKIDIYESFKCHVDIVYFHVSHVIYRLFTIHADIGIFSELSNLNSSHWIATKVSKIILTVSLEISITYESFPIICILTVDSKSPSP